MVRSVCTLKVELMVIAVVPDMGYEKIRGVREGSRVLA